jgi:hypothetical protein
MELEFFLRPTVSRPVSLGIGPPFGTLDQSLFSSSFVGQLRCSLSMRPLWRENGCVIYCTIASGPCQSNHTWAEVPQNSRPYFTVSFDTPPTWRTRFPYLYPQGTGWPSYTPGHWVPFLSPLTTRRDYGGGILTRLHTGDHEFSTLFIVLCFIWNSTQLYRLVRTSQETHYVSATSPTG